MNRALKVVLAVGLPAAALAVGQSASASAPPTAPPGSELTTPADVVAITDDTGTITVEVPSSWTDVATAPDGATPFIEASTDREQYNATFDVAGVTYRAAPFNADTETAARQYGLTSGCGSETIEAYNDGVFEGAHLIYTECGPSESAEFHVIAANPASGAFTALLRIQITGADEEPILQGILDTFNIAPSGTTSSTPAAASTVPATTAATDAFPQPTGSVPAEWTRLVDDTQTISISVPNTWTATDLAPAANDDGTPQPWISATTDQDLFFPAPGTADTFSVPGVIYRAFPYSTDTMAPLTASSMNDLCTAGPLQTYDDSVFVGHIQTYTACGGTTSSVVRVVANPDDQAFTADLLIQLTGQPDDADTLNGLLLSFDRVDPDAASATTVAGAPTATAAADPATTAASGSPFVELLQQQLQDQLGLTITPEQGQCLLDNAGDLDPEDLQAVVTVLTTCGVDVMDLPSG
jgi:hypothetical protein